MTGLAPIGCEAAGPGARTDTDAGAERAELGALLELNALPQAGPARLRALLKGRNARGAVRELGCGDPEILADLAECPGVNATLVASWRQRLETAQQRSVAASRAVGTDRVEAHERAGIWIEIPTAGTAGELWRGDPEPPGVLFGRGAPVDLGIRRVGIVGTRRCSAYGRTVAQDLGEGLAAEGVAVVSGLAAGIDGIAQRAALDAGGPVIGVVGSGLDCVYPATNRALWDDIAQQGTLLSEYPLGMRAVQWHFPARNRIVAALCEVLVVVESGEAGGSLYTVEAAAERDRPVLAVPGAITNDASRGTNRLLAEGCAPVCDLGDILVALGHSSRDPGRNTASRRPPAPDNPLDRAVLDVLGADSRTVDQLVLRTESSLSQIASSLGRLELSGWVVETGGWWEKAR